MSTNSPAIDRRVAVAREYDALMGLSNVLLGAGFFLAAVTDQPGVWLAVAAALSASAPQWYHRRYGYTRPRLDRVVWTCTGAAVFLFVLAAAWVLDRWLTPPVVLSLLVVAVGLCVCHVLSLRRTGLTPAHWVVYALLVLAAFAPLVGVPNAGLFTPLALAATGLALITLGLVDHRRLSQAMAPGPGDDEALQR